MGLFSEDRKVAELYRGTLLMSSASVCSSRGVREHNEQLTVILDLLSIKDSDHDTDAAFRFRMRCKHKCKPEIRATLPSRDGLVVIFKIESADSPSTRAAEGTSVTEIISHNNELNIEKVGDASTVHEFAFRQTGTEPFKVYGSRIQGGEGFIIASSSSESAHSDVIKKEREYWCEGKVVRTTGLPNALNDREAVICGGLNPIHGTLGVRIGEREVRLPLANLIHPGETHVFTTAFQSKGGQLLTETIEADRPSFQRAGINGNICIEALIQTQLMYEHPDSKVYFRIICSYFRLCMRCATGAGLIPRSTTIQDIQDRLSRVEQIAARRIETNSNICR